MFKIVDKIIKSLPNSNDEFITYKEKLLKQRIKRKIDKYLICNKDIEQLKSLIDELRCCKARYQQYSRVFDLYVLQIENIIEI